MSAADDLSGLERIAECHAERIARGDGWRQLERDYARLEYAQAQPVPLFYRRRSHHWLHRRDNSFERFCPKRVWSLSGDAAIRARRPARSVARSRGRFAQSTANAT